MCDIGLALSSGNGDGHTGRSIWVTMEASVKALFARVALLVVALAPTQALAAASTTCLCRTDDGKAFRELTLRHHRWACDYHLGYVKSSEPPEKGDRVVTKVRPSTETCNIEEVVQFKTYLCMESGCSYAYVRSTAIQNRALKTIKPLRGPRTP
jgi:hypothetical protein